MVWNDLLGQIPVSLLRRIDAYQLLVLCQCVVQSRNLNRLLQLDPTDYKAMAKYLALVAHISRLSAQFGLSPIDRQRMKAPTDTEGDELSEWMDDR